MEILNDNNFVQYAMRNYENPHCVCIEDFESDLRRVRTICRYLNRYEKDRDDVKERATLNNVIVLINVFGVHCTANMLFFKTPKDQWKYLKPYFVYLNQMPDKLLMLNVYEHSIEMDVELYKRLLQL